MATVTEQQKVYDGMLILHIDHDAKTVTWFSHKDCWRVGFMTVDQQLTCIKTGAAAEQQWHAKGYKTVGDSLAEIQYAIDWECRMIQQSQEAEYWHRQMIKEEEFQQAMDDITAVDDMLERGVEADEVAPLEWEYEADDSDEGYDDHHLEYEGDE